MEKKETKSKVNLLKESKYFNLLKCIITGIICIGIGALIGRESIANDYNKLVDEYNEISKNHDEEVDNLNSKLSKANEKVKNAEPWFKMGEEEQKKIEAENARIEKEKKEKEEAEKKAKEEAEAKKQQQAEEEKKKNEQQEYNTGITYKQLARDEQEYWYKKVTFKGKVLQVQEGSEENIIRLAVDGNYDNVLIVRHLKPRVGDRILENDWITVRGIFNGLESYTSVIGSEITLPAILSDDGDIDR